MASIRVRTRRGGIAAFSVLWREPDTGKQTSWTLTDHASAVQFKRVIEANHGHLDATLALLTAAATKSPTVRTVMAEHIDGLAGVTERTRKDYRRDSDNHIVPELGHIPVDQLTAARVRDWVRRLAARTPTISDKTIANVHGLLSAAMTTAIEARHRLDNPCVGVRLPRRDAEHENIAITREQWDAIDAQLGRYVKGWYRPLYRTLLFTGLRWGEATALQVRDLTLTAPATIRVSHAMRRDENSKAYDGPTKTKRSRRTVPIPAVLLPDMVAQVADKAPTDLVFPGPQGKHIHASNARARAWVPAIRAVQKAGLLVETPRAHDLRHTYASWLIAAGIDPLTVQRQMGHENISTTTNVYAAVMPAQSAAAAAAIDAIMS